MVPPNKRQVLLLLSSQKAHRVVNKLSNFIGHQGFDEETRSHQHVITGNTVNYVRGNQTNTHTHIYQKGILFFPVKRQILANSHSVSDDKLDKIFKWLSPTIPSANYDAALKIRLQETGMWFINSEQFSEWKKTADSLFWLYGKRML
jgi:hypothetical protein